MNRIQSVDIFRLIAILAVIVIHSTPFNVDLSNSTMTYKYMYIISDQVARFAVPFFFVISGYFWGIKARTVDNPMTLSNNMAKRISWLFMIWCFIYLLPLNLASIYDFGILAPIKSVYWYLTDSNPINLLFEGTKVHLWFLVSLLFSLYIAAFFIYKQRIKSLIVLSILLYFFGILSRSYADTPIGIDINFNTRNGPFFGLLLFVSGFILSGIKTNPSWFKYGLLIFAFGIALHFSEIYLLWKYFGIYPRHDYVIGTYFMGMGVAMIALSNHKMLQNSSLSHLGKMTLGIYAIHFIFIDWLNVIDKRVDAPWWEISYVFLVFGLSIISVLLLSKHKVMKKIVM